MLNIKKPKNNTTPKKYVALLIILTQNRMFCHKELRWVCLIIII